MDDPRPASIHSLVRHNVGPAQPVKAHFREIAVLRSLVKSKRKKEETDG